MDQKLAVNDAQSDLKWRHAHTDRGAMVHDVGETITHSRASAGNAAIVSKMPDGNASIGKNLRIRNATSRLLGFACPRPWLTSGCRLVRSDLKVRRWLCATALERSKISKAVTLEHACLLEGEFKIHEL